MTDSTGSSPHYALNYILNALDFIESGTWIINTSASNHMCVDSKLIDKLIPLHKPTTVSLPDGSIKNVYHIGNITLNSKLVFTDTVYLPSFKFNLLSVNKLAKTSHIKLIFNPTYCVLQDLKTEDILAIGKVIGSLYILDKHCFSPEVLSSFNKQHSLDRILQVHSPFNSSCNDSIFANKVSISSKSQSTWHKRLGHASSTVLQHIPVLSCNAPNSLITQGAT